MPERFSGPGGRASGRLVGRGRVAGSVVVRRRGPRGRLGRCRNERAVQMQGGGQKEPATGRDRATKRNVLQSVWATWVQTDRQGSNTGRTRARIVGFQSERAWGLFNMNLDCTPCQDGSRATDLASLAVRRCYACHLCRDVMVWSAQLAHHTAAAAAAHAQAPSQLTSLY